MNGNGLDDASGLDGPGKGDRTFVGNPNPTSSLGLRASVVYKGLSASIYMNGSFGNQVFDNTALALFSRAALEGGANVDKRVLSSPQSASDSPVPSTLWMENGNFFRFTNLNLGYNFNMDAVDWLSSLRLYFTAQNLFVFTNYNGFDPEVNTDKAVDEVPSFGIDYSSYPRPRTYTLGINFVLQ